jgi:hypothetical protein
MENNVTWRLEPHPGNFICRDWRVSRLADVRRLEECATIAPSDADDPSPSHRGIPVCRTLLPHDVVHDPEDQGPNRRSAAAIDAARFDRYRAGAAGVCQSSGGKVLQEAHGDPGGA